MTIKLGTKLPRKENRNGLGVIHSTLLRDPHRTHVAVVVLTTAKITDDFETEDRYPTVQIVAIEPITASEDVGTIRRITQRAHEERTGDLELPGDWEAVFTGMTSPTLPGTEPDAR